jgi:3-hydroxybutyryl-CoA dehydrogenase
MTSRVGVVGGGLMGARIAEVSARAGLDVVLVETKGKAATGARKRIDASLHRAEAKQPWHG